MYGRPQQKYPRQYGNGHPPQQQQQQQYPPQQQQQYPPQQQQQYPPQQQQPGAYPPRGQYAPRQAYPAHQQPPSYGGGGPPPPRGAYGQNGPQAPPPAMPLARGSLPNGGGRNPIPPVVSSYELAAQKWKKGFAAAPGSATGTASSGGSRSSDIEAPLIAELCSSAGSSYPPRDVLQKLLRHLPSLDHEYVCELLDDKLDDRVWQVQGKALSVLDALCKSPQGDVFKTYYYYHSHVLQALCNSRKDLLRARAEKVFNVIKSHTPPAPPSPVGGQEQEQADSSMAPPSQVRTQQAAPPPREEVNLLGSPLLMAQEEPAQAPPSSAFGFLNAGGDAPTPEPAAVPTTQAPEQPPTSAFSFLSSQPAAPPAAPVASVVAATPVAPVAAAPAVFDIFSSLPPPTPIIGLVTQEPEPSPTPPAEEEEEEEEKEPPVHDPIHDAFEGLNFGDDDDGAEGDATTATFMEKNDINPLEGFSAASNSTMGFVASAITVYASDPLREIILEVDVPAGPMGLVLDRSIPNMAVVQGFIRMPTGERGYLELHPVLCPGCALVSINSMNIEDKDLEEVGAMLGSLMNSYKVLRFKKLMRSGRTVSPADSKVAYVPPPPEKVEAPPVKEEEEGANETEDGEGSEFIEQLTGYSTQLDDIAAQIDALVDSKASVVDSKNQLAQLHGNVEKIQTQGIDAVILGENPPANADDIRQLRSSLVRRADELTKRIQQIALNGTGPVAAAPLPIVTPVVVGSPEVSAFSFVDGANGMPSMPSLQLSEPAAVQPPSSSTFSFLQASTSSPVSSPVGAGPSGSAFGFLASGSSGTPAPAPTPAVSSNAVFAGLSLRSGVEAPQQDTSSSSAFGFLSNASTPAIVGVVDPPRVASPTAFSFLRGGAGGIVSPPSSPQASGRPGSAFSFIS